MKRIFYIFIFLTAIYISRAEDLKTICPLLTSEDQFISMVKVTLPTIKPLWVKSGTGVYFGVFSDKNSSTLYICFYPTDPRNLPQKDLMEQWNLTDQENKNIALGDIEWGKVNELKLTSAAVYSGGNWLGSPYYFGVPIPLWNIKQETIRVNLPNLHWAFDYSIKKGEILQKYTIDVSTKLIPLK